MNTLGITYSCKTYIRCILQAVVGKMKLAARMKPLLSLFLWTKPNNDLKFTVAPTSRGDRRWLRYDLLDIGARRHSAGLELCLQTLAPPALSGSLISSSITVVNAPLDADDALMFTSLEEQAPAQQVRVFGVDAYVPNSRFDAFLLACGARQPTRDAESYLGGRLRICSRSP